MDDGDVVLYRFGPVGKCTGLFYWVVVVVGGLGVRGAVAVAVPGASSVSVTFTAPALVPEL